MTPLARQNLILGSATAGALGILAIVMVLASRSETTVNVMAPAEPVGTTTITSGSAPVSGATNETPNASAPGGAPATVGTATNMTPAAPQDVNVNIYMPSQPQAAPAVGVQQAPAQQVPVQQAPAQTQAVQSQVVPAPVPYTPAQPAPGQSMQPAPAATPSSSTSPDVPAQPPPQGAPTVTPPGVSTSPPAGVPTDSVPSQPYYP